MAYSIKRFPHQHNYPFDWRKGTHLLSYPVDSWFIRTSSIKDQLVDANKKINWHPKNVRDGRFGRWLENNVDWALSRKRYWELLCQYGNLLKKNLILMM